MITRKIYAYAHPSRQDPHALQLLISTEDSERVAEQFARETDLKPYESGEWFRVTDQSTGREWEIRTAPCERSCRCACDARAVSA